MAETGGEEERRRIRVIVIFLVVAAVVALAGAWVYSLPSLSTAPPPSPAATRSP